MGLGWVTTARHIPALRRARGVTLAGVIDPTQQKVDAARRRFRVALGSTSGNPSQVEWLDQVDAVTIGTPPQTHFRLAREFLRAGKHVLVEKPMTMTPVEAEDLIATAKSAGKILAVVHNFQFARSVTRLRRLVAEGKLGELRGVMGLQLSNPARRLPAWYEDLPLGLFADESPHLLYLVRSVAGPQVRVENVDVLPDEAPRRTPQLVDMLLTAGGVPIKLTMHFKAPVSEWHLAVLGAKGMAVADIFRDVLVITGNDGAHLAPSILRTSLQAAASHFGGTLTSGIRLVSRSLRYGNDEVMARFVAACRDGVAPEGIEGADGLWVVKLQDQVSLRGGAMAA